MNAFSRGMLDMTNALKRLIENPQDQEAEAASKFGVPTTRNPITGEHARDCECPLCQEPWTAPIPFHETEEWKRHEQAHEAYLMTRSGCDE